MIKTYERKLTFHGWERINHFYEMISLLGQSMMVKGKFDVSLKSVQCLNVTTKYTAALPENCPKLHWTTFTVQCLKSHVSNRGKTSWGFTWIINIMKLHWTCSIEQPSHRRLLHCPGNDFLFHNSQSPSYLTTPNFTPTKAIGPQIKMAPIHMTWALHENNINKTQELNR